MADELDIITKDRLRALENLREVCGMNCERLPGEVRDALHEIPELERTHVCAITRADADAQWRRNRATLERAEWLGLI